MKTMKQSTIMKALVIIAIVILGIASAWAQEIGMPIGLFEHGKNSLNNATTSENTDSVTVGSVMQYWVAPDGAFTGTTSTFSWAISGWGLIASTTTNLSTVTYGAATGSGTINVAETSPTPSCSGSASIIDFAVIDAPTANFGADPTAQCASASAVNYSLPINVTTAISGATVRVNYTIFNPSNVGLTGQTNINVELTAGAARTITATIPAGSTAGTYYAKINSITDRISRKPSIDIEGAFSAGNDRIDIIVNPLPVTGKIYHLPNN